MRSADADTLDALRRGDLAGARELRLGGLTEFPREILALADTLEVLDLSGGSLAALPDDFGRLRTLRVLFCSGNRFDRLPPVLGACPALAQVGFRAAGLREVPGESLPPALRWLTLTGNAVRELPDAIGARPALQKLMLAGNRLTRLPPSLAGATNLELLRIAANGVGTLPGWLAELPRLAWIAYAGNPAEPSPEPAAAAAEVPWADLELGALLGEGASGRIYRAVWRRGDLRQAVALKLFKGAMTSDGLPEHEMAAGLAAGVHPTLTGALGRVAGRPDAAEGFVMPLLPASWQVLAAPPSLTSCTRDVYDPAQSFTAGAVTRTASDVAAALAHLHGRGLVHGDVYAHNTVWDPGSGRAVLGDFGAASRLPPGPDGEALQRVEARAWGIMVSELVERCADPDAIPAVVRELAAACLVPAVARRPPMTAVRARLAAEVPQASA